MAEHDARLRSVLDRLAKYGATLRVEKCVLGQPEVDFNGHRVTVGRLLTRGPTPPTCCYRPASSIQHATK
jgi:hypothetical protein